MVFYFRKIFLASLGVVLPNSLCAIWSTVLSALSSLLFFSFFTLLWSRIFSVFDLPVRLPAIAIAIADRAKRSLTTTRGRKVPKFSRKNQLRFYIWGGIWIHGNTKPNPLHRNLHVNTKKRITPKAKGKSHWPHLEHVTNCAYFQVRSLRGVSSVACGKPNFADGAVWEHQAWYSRQNGNILIAVNGIIVPRYVLPKKLLERPKNGTSLNSRFMLLYHMLRPWRMRTMLSSWGFLFFIPSSCLLDCFSELFSW